MEFKTLYCKGKVNISNNAGFLDVELRINEKVKNGTITYFAAAPPDYMTNFTGSGLPFPNESIAFENTPNKGVIDVDPTEDAPFITIHIQTPNAYYTRFDTFVPSCVDVFFNGRKIRIQLNKATPPFRSLTHVFPQRESVDIKSQDQLIKTKAYPKL